MLILDQKPPWPARLQGFHWGIHCSPSAVTGRLESSITPGYGQVTQDSGNLSLESQLQSSREGLETACIFRKTKRNLLLAVLCVITLWARKGTEQPAETNSLSPWSSLSSIISLISIISFNDGREWQGMWVRVSLCSPKLQKRDSTNP